MLGAHFAAKMVSRGEDAGVIGDGAREVIVDRPLAVALAERGGAVCDKAVPVEHVPVLVQCAVAWKSPR